MHYTLILTLTLAVLFGLQSFALKQSGGRTAKSESNFFSSVGRIQAGAADGVKLMVLGSSITGRLPDRAQGVEGTANMGCDGGSAVDALRAMDAGILPVAPRLVIEANTLHLALEKKPSEIGSAMKRPWFKAGLQVPNLAAYARPSAFLYSKLLERRIGGFDLKPGEDLGESGKPQAVPAGQAVSLKPEEESLVAEIHGILDRLSRRGTQAMIVWLPPTRPSTSLPPPWILELARRSGIPYWDLSQQIQPGTVTLTDGVHMAAPSAARTMASLVKASAP